MVKEQVDIPIPNLFIAGAPKSGSSFLYQNLGLHPDIFFPKVKELNYFSCSQIQQLPSYYQDYLTDSLEKYHSHFKAGKNHQYRVDSSVSYFTFPEVPNKIKEFNPNAKFIFILRNPIKQAHSHYQMDVRMGVVSHTFQQIIQNPSVSPVHSFQYIENGYYYKHIHRYIEVFGAKQVCVLVLETIEQDLKKLFDFLDLTEPAKEINTNKAVNEHKKPRNKWIQRLHSNRKLVSKLKRIIPKSLIQRVNKHLYVAAEREQLDIASETYLRQLFKDDVAALSKLLNRDLETLWQMKP